MAAISLLLDGPHRQVLLAVADTPVARSTEKMPHPLTFTGLRNEVRRLSTIDNW